MVRASLGTASTLALGVLGFAPLNEGSAAGGREPIVQLAGRWAGQGTLTPAYGPAESFKCSITYFPSEDGSRVTQNLRCRGANHRFDAATHLQIAGEQVTGKWMDNIYSLTGTVSGIVTQSGFDILLSGRHFAAKMTVVSSRCEQSVTVVPERKSDMKELAAVLKKC